jgi:glycosyltransferase involved in cell wall biosynthesis
MTKLKVGILGTRGIPNNYGGYEQAATYLSAGLVERGYEVTVYNSHNHPFREKIWNGVEIVRCYDPEHQAGTAGQFIYDLNCIRHARKRNYDVLLLLGYTSSSVWGRFYPKRTVIISNMDGLEWKRAKYAAPVKKYLKIAEKWAVQYSDHLIADSPEIQSYLQATYAVASRHIPYGAEIRRDESITALEKFGVEKGEYYLLVARMEPENSIEMILDGFVSADSGKQFIVVGNATNKFGRKMQQKFGARKKISFIGSLFDQQQLHSLKAFCSLYFHGHSVGGTNPSLLEAMASRCPVAAHDNPFNKAVLGVDGTFFSNAADVQKIISTPVGDGAQQEWINNNLEKINRQYNWPAIIDQYANYINECMAQKNQ